MSNSLVRQYLPGDSNPGLYTQHNIEHSSRVWKNIKHIVLKALGKENSVLVHCHKRKDKLQQEHKSKQFTWTNWVSIVSADALAPTVTRGPFY